MLLTSDWHLDDNPRNEYRWEVFTHIEEWFINAPGEQEVFMLGDLTDRKDRHSARLTNRLVTQLLRLTALGMRFTILMGNHDKPLNGPPFWDILSEVGARGDAIPIKFISKPYAWADLLLLPHSDDPGVDWRDIPFKNYRALFMHQTVTGAAGNNGIVLENNRMPVLPRALKVYSGDIHLPQMIAPGGRRVTYVGAPHPVSFGDDHLCRMLELNEDYAITREITLPAIQKLVLRIPHPDALADIEVHSGDQIRVLCKLAPADLEKWPGMQETIIAWGRERKVILVSVEPDIDGPRVARDTSIPAPEADPEAILRLFAEAEGIDTPMFDFGVELLRKARG